MKSPARGAAASIHVASAPGLREATGQFFTVRGTKRSSPRSYDVVAAARLWRVSAHMTGLAEDSVLISRVSGTSATLSSGS